MISTTSDNTVGMLTMPPLRKHSIVESMPDKYDPPMRETISTYHIIQTLHTVHDTFEIQYKGRALYTAEIKRPALGRPKLTLTTPKVDGGSVVAAARLGMNTVGCQVALGGDLNEVKKQDWIGVERTGRGDVKMFVFTIDGEEYAWKRKYDQYDNFPHEDLLFIRVSAPEIPLAAYLRNRKAVSAYQVGRLDVYEDMDPDLGLLCLTSVLGVEQGLQARKGELGSWFGGGSGMMGVGAIGLSFGGGGGAC